MRRRTYAQLALLCFCLACTSVDPPKADSRCRRNADCPATQVCDTGSQRCVGAAELGSSRTDAGADDASVAIGGTGGAGDAGEELAAGSGGTGGARAMDAGRAPQRDAAGSGGSGESNGADAGSCKPEAERCDDRDNDCDTRVDEELSEACGSSEGECQPGKRSCERGDWSECSGEVMPQRELCDALDNDCNGVVDDAAECELHWKRVSVAPGPAAREQSAHAYDSQNKLFVIHGGFSQNVGTADTWAFDVTSNSWRKLSDTGPSPRRDHAMAYDAARQRVVLFGGFTGDSGLNDTWELDGQTWQARSTEHTPDNRSLHAMVYDSARQRVVMFGGFSSGAVSAQTWEYDGNDWQERAIAGPAARRSPALTYDSEHKRVLLFGGSTEWGEGDRVTSGFNDLWAYDGASWQQLVAADPPRARWFTSLVWHPTRKVAFLYGGVQMETNLSDTYELDGTRWRARSSAFGMPDVSYSASIIYDPVGDRLLSFGGTTAANNHTDAVWELD